MQVGNQKLKVGSQKSEGGGRKSEVGSKKMHGSRKSLLGFRIIQSNEGKTSSLQKGVVGDICKSQFACDVQTLTKLRQLQRQLRSVKFT